MYLQRLEFDNFRNLKKQSVKLSKNVEWFVGPNGQGKTNFLEGVYLVMTTRSFRTATLRDVVGPESARALVTAKLVKDIGRHELHVAVKKGIERRCVDGKKSDSLNYLKKGCVIAFTARSKEVIQGAPEMRRLFLDRHVANFDKQHIADLGRHRKNLQQLRPLVHQRGDVFTYRSFKAASVKVAERIATRRREYLASWKKTAQDIFREVFEYEGVFELNYRVRNARSESYEKRMMSLCAAELLHGRMLMGPQLDDLEVVFDGKPMRQMASSGQIRAVVLSLKFAIRESFFKRYGNWPILILDDIDSELDNERISRVLEYVSKRGQTLISTSKCGIIKRHLCGDTFLLTDGRVIPKRTGE